MYIPRNMTTKFELGRSHDPSTGALRSIYYAPIYNEGYLKSQGNYGWQDLNAKSLRTGGTFEASQLRCLKEDYKLSPPMRPRGSASSRYAGVYATAIDKSDFPNLPTRELESYGPKAWATMKPTAPVMDLAVALAELREFPRMTWELFKKELPRADRGFLAYQFGWKPLINDLIKLVSIQEELEKKINWLIRNNGKPVRTECKLLSNTSDPVMLEGFSNSYIDPIPAVTDRAGTPYYRQIMQSSTEIWACARFRYHLPPAVESMKGRAKLKRALNGLMITPSVLYNLVPWSWLIDWFTNVGDVIENLDAGVADRLAADYFYLMCQEKHSIQQFCSANILISQTVAIPITMSTYGERTFKRRIVGSPFGFGVKDIDLSAIQLAILGALGSSRLYR